MLQAHGGTAQVIEKFQTCEPAVTENKLGKGTAVILGADASFSMKNKGNDFMEGWTVGHLLKNLTLPYSCPNAIVYRISSPTADHYFFINDDEAKNASLKFAQYQYKKITDAMTGEAIQVKEIALESHSGRWIRCEK